MHAKSDDKEIMISDKAGVVIKKLFKSFLNRYQNNLETSMKGNEFVLDYVHLLYYSCNKVNLSCGGSYIDSPDWKKTKQQ